MFVINTFHRWLFFFGIIGFLGIWAGSTGVVAADSEALLAWGERDKQGKYRLHFTRYDGKQWSAPLLLSSGEDEAILPAVASDGRSTIWVAWTELKGVHGTIRYRVSSRGAWSAPAYLKTSTMSDLAPSLAVGADGVAWMAFSGSDGIQDDIFVVRWLGQQWSQPEKIHADNDSPDILPQLFIDSNDRPVVFWQGFDGDQYRTFSSYRNNARWSAAKVEQDSRHFFAGNGLSSALSSKENQAVRELPPFVKDTSQAVLHLKTGQTINMRFGGR